MAKYTIFGGRGFIGTEIVRKLIQGMHDVQVPARDDINIFKRDLGIVIYCAGNGDCNNTPFSVYEANTNLLVQLLQGAKFHRLIYISSTRVYMNQNRSNESSDLTVCTSDKRRLFNLTKLLSEELCLRSGRNVTILRPSNVYGVSLNSPLFLPSITRDAIDKGVVNMFVTPEYEKDYVSVFDVADAVARISMMELESGEILNIASGANTSARDIAEILKAKTNCEINWLNVDGDTEFFTEIDISTLTHYITFKPRNVLDDLFIIINKYQKIKLG